MCMQQVTNDWCYEIYMKQTKCMQLEKLLCKTTGKLEQLIHIYTMHIRCSLCLIYFHIIESRG